MSQTKQAKCQKATVARNQNSIRDRMERKNFVRIQIQSGAK